VILETARRTSVPTNADQLEDSADSTPHRAGLAFVALGLLVFTLAEPIADFVTWILPGRFQIRSTATQLESLEMLAPTIVRRTGVVLIVSGAVATVSVLWAIPSAWRSPRLGQVAGGLVVAGTAAWYGWLSNPHQAFLSNARFHWVDYQTWDSDNYTYAAGRIPHLLFYEYPYVWQGINAGLVALLCYAIGRQLGHSTWISAAMATLPAIAGNLLLFASTAEDVMLNTLLLLFAVWAALRRRALMLGFALGLVMLGRPSFFVLLVCFIAAEVVQSLRSRRGIKEFDWRYVSSTTGIAVTFMVSAQILFSILGDRPFFVNGQFIQTEGLDALVPRRVEGFLIAPFSGVYAGHLLWVAPLVFLIGATASLVTARGQNKRIEAVIYLCGLFVVAHILVHEAKPLAYYNTRYLAFVIPSLFAMSWAAIAHPRFPARGPGRTIAIALLVLGPAVLPVNPIEVKRSIEARPETQLLSVRYELRELAAGKSVFLNFGDELSRNYLAYVLRRDAATIRLLDEELSKKGLAGIVDDELEFTSDSIVISFADDPYNSESPDISVGDFIVTDGSE